MILAQTLLSAPIDFEFRSNLRASPSRPARSNLKRGGGLVADRQSEMIVTDENHHNEGAKPEGITAALRGWGLVVAMVVAVLGAAYAFVAMTE